MADLKLSSVKKSFDDICALKQIDLEIKDQEFFVLLGPTGAGKTTTLRIIAGLEQPDEGDIFLGRERVNDFIPALRDVAFVFQYYNLYPNFTVRQNLEFPLKSELRNLPQDEINKRVENAARILHIENLLDRGTTNLSGGEMQRVAIGRAIVRTPKVFLMDEPLSNLDAKLREEMRAELSHLHQDLGFTFLYVTHDQVEALTLGDRIGVLHQGEILQIGTPDEIYYAPSDMYVAKFVGSPAINFFDVLYKDESLYVPGKDRLCRLSEKNIRILENFGQEKVVLGVRPEDVQVTRQMKEENSIETIIYFKQSMGADDLLNLKVNDTVFRAVAPSKLDAKAGEKVFAAIKIDRVHLFDPATEIRLSFEN
jgi:multiple sugar transport system ATP-binding protein